MSFVIAVDTETKGFDWWNPEQQAFIATTYDSAGENIAYELSNEYDLADLADRLRSADVIVGHNMKFDAHQLRETVGLDVFDFGAEVHDTELLARVYAPEDTYGEHGGFGLEALTRWFLGREGKEGKQAMQEVAEHIGLRTLSATGAYYQCWLAAAEVVEKYAKLDARDTFDLYEYLRALDVTAGQRSIYELERAVLPIMVAAEARGTAVQPQATRKLHTQYLKEQKTLRKSLVAKLGEKALGGEGSEEALVEALQKEGVELTERTETGKLSTAKWVLDKQAAAHPVVAEFQEYRHVNKFLSTYIEPLDAAAQNGGVIHPNFRIIGTWTGRMSCTSPNMQNVPVRSGPEVRSAIVPREHYSLLAVDFDSIEVRVLTHYLGTHGKAFRDLINAGLDPHAWMSSELALRGVQPWASAGSTAADFAKDGPNAKLRAQAKNSALFPILYGAGGCKLCESNGLPTGPPLTATDWLVRKGYKQIGDPSCAQGQEIAKAVKAAIPGYTRLMRRVRDKVEGDGYVTTIGGRKQRLLRDKGYIGMAALIQGSAADIMKAALIATQAVLDEFHGSLLLAVHDEIVVEVPTPDAEIALGLLVQAMEQAWDLDPPLIATGGIFENWGAAK